MQNCVDSGQRAKPATPQATPGRSPRGDRSLDHGGDGPGERRQLDRPHDDQHQQPIAPRGIGARVAVQPADQPQVERPAIGLLLVVIAPGASMQWVAGGRSCGLPRGFRRPGMLVVRRPIANGRPGDSGRAGRAIRRACRSRQCGRLRAPGSDRPAAACSADGRRPASSARAWPRRGRPEFRARSRGSTAEVGSSRIRIGRVEQNRPGQGQPLPLPARKIRAHIRRSPCRIRRASD